MQSYGLELLMLMEELEADARQTQLLRAESVPGGSEQEEPPSEYTDPAEDAGRDFDYSEVDWDEGATADEWSRMQEALGSSRVTVGTQTQESDTPDVPAVDFDRDFDREWT